MSRYDDDYDIDDTEDEDEYDDYMDEDDDDDSSSSRSSVNPFSTGISRPAGPGGNRFGDSSRLPGSPSASRGPSGPPPPSAPRPGGNMPGRPSAPSSMPGSGAGPSRPSAPPGRGPSPSPFAGSGSAIPQRSPADSSSGPSRPSPFGSSSNDKPATPRGGSAFGKPAGNNDQKDDKGGGLGSRLGGLTSRLPGRGDKDDDKPATPRFGGGNDKSSTPKSSPLGSLTSRFGGNKDDKPAAPKKEGGGLASRFGGGNKADKPAAPKKEGDKGGMFSGLTSRLPGRGGDKPNDAPKPGGGPSSSPFGSRIGSPGAAPGGPARAQAAAKPARPSLSDRLKNFSLFKKTEPKAPRSRQDKGVSVQKPGVSLDTKLDILGVVLVLSALALIFSSLSPNQGQLTGTVNRFLSENLGWGAPAVPLAMFAAGVWLILRHFGEEAPVLDTVPVIGVVMIYIGLLVAFQYADSFTYEVQPGSPPLDQLKNIFLPLSQAYGRGGGWVGAEIYYFLVANLTEIGGFFVMLAWLIVGLMLTLSLSVAEMAIVIISVWRSFNDARHRRIERRNAALAEQQALSAAALPGVTVTRPGTEQLPAGARSPALPAGGLYGDFSGEERSIPITQGGRTVTASFRPGDPVPVERETPQRPQPTPTFEAASVADAPAQDKPAGRSGLFGALPRRSAAPSNEDNSDARSDSAGSRFGLGSLRRHRNEDVDTADETDEKSGGIGSRFGGFARTVRTVLPGTDKSDETPDTAPTTKSAQATATNADAAEMDKPSGMSRFASPFARMRDAIPGIKPAEKADDAEDEDEAEGAPQATPKPIRATSEVLAAPARPGPSAPTPTAAEPDDIDDEDDEEDEENTVSFGSLLSQQAKPNVRPPSRPTAPPTRMPAAEPVSTPKADEPPADETAENTATEAPAASTNEDKPAAEQQAPRPFGRSIQAPPPRGSSRLGENAPPARPSPFRSPVGPPSYEPAGDDGEDEDDETLDLLNDTADSTATPARPKGIGPLPRPSAPSPFNRTSSAIPDPSRAPTTSLQERLAALRSGSTFGSNAAKPDEDEKPAAEKSTPKDVRPTERPTTEAPRAVVNDEPTAPADAVEEDGDETESAAPAGSEAKHNEDTPKPDTPSAPVAEKKSTPPTRSQVAPAAYQMPERPTPPPPPARGASTNPSTPPVAPPPPPQSKPGRRKVWELPDYGELLANGADQDMNHDQLLERAKIIEETLASFGAPGRVVEVRTGPVVTQFGVEPDYLPGRGGKKIRVKVSGIAQLDKDLQLALGARSIRIEAPVPGKGYVGIEVPNDKPTVVRLRDVLESPEFQKIKSPLGICLGQGVDGTPVAADLAAMPHLLIAGTTGSGKSVCVNTIIASLLVKNSPDRVKFIMVDPKRVELTGYNGVPHLVAPVVVELERIVGVLKWVTREMDERYKKFSNVGARNIEDFNKHLPAGEQQMPYIVVFIDELADLMMLAPDETERVITRIAALARATGIHLVIATQRPSVDVVTGLIKANFPARIAFAVASNTDSRVILDQPGAERLLGRGDMLYMSGDAPAPQRLQGVFVSDAEINNVTQYWRSQLGPEDMLPKSLATGFLSEDSGSASATSGWGNNRTGSRVPTEQAAFWDHELRDGASSLDEDDEDGEDAMYDEAVELVRRLNKASVSLLQRRLRIGYTRAARLIDIMEERGIIGPPTEGSKPREVLPSG